MIRNCLAFFAAAVLAAFCASANAQGRPFVLGEPVKQARPAVEPKLRIAAEVRGPQVKLSAVPQADVERVRAANGAAASNGRANLKRVVIGVNREFEVEKVSPGAQALDWINVPNGRAARLSLTSPDAGALRIALDLRGAARDLEMVFFGSASPQRLFGPVRVAAIADRTQPFWSPLTEGETLTVEFFVPRLGASGEADPRVVNLAHLFASPAARDFAKRLNDIGRAGSCNIDVPCSPLDTSAAFQNVANSVAEMVFNDGSYTVLCTGTLLNDTDTSSQVPWFYSANHCFDNSSQPYKTPAQMQAVAATLTTLWFFEASACGSASPNPNWQQMSAGATYIYNDQQADALFLRLNANPPAGAFFAGWDANALTPGTAIVGIHHPQGDLKKVSQGSVLGFAVPNPASNSQYVEVHWTSGTTEAGSSGSGLFTAASSQYLLRGGLWGGYALCSNQNGSDFFSRFDQVYPALSPYLAAAVTPFANFTDLWWNANESGWGLNVTQHASTNRLFAVWYTYGPDGKRTWYVLPAGSWTSASTFTGDIYLTSGPAFSASFDPSVVKRTPSGTGTLTFSDANHGTWSYSIDGFSGVKSITRQPF